MDGSGGSEWFCGGGVLPYRYISIRENSYKYITTAETYIMNACAIITAVPPSLQDWSVLQSVKYQERKNIFDDTVSVLFLWITKHNIQVEYIFSNNCNAGFILTTIHDSMQACHRTCNIKVIA